MKRFLFFFFFLDSRYYTNTRFANQEDLEYRFIFVVLWNNNPTLIICVHDAICIFLFFSLPPPINVSVYLSHNIVRGKHDYIAVDW